MKGVTSGQSLQGAFLESISILTPAKGVTPRCDRGGRRVIHFNSHPRERGDIPADVITHFNSHPREGGDFSNIDHAIPVGDISIPTPAKGVTLPLYGSRGYLAISILTPARGGDVSTEKNCDTRSYFNSHPREGG